ncbi:MAG: L-xylulose 5-phosphate 3-epimerase [Spirochaetes bacterium]|nr:MAG: L-xylulose 5-phosphate 3-epimerase [Spirochaetota bacterium]
MMDKASPRLGIYEKAMPRFESWAHRLEAAASAGYGFVEMSIDESDERLSRLEWGKAERRAFRDATLDAGVPVPSLCLSGHRRYPLGSADPSVRAKAWDMMEKAVDLAADLGIRTIQLAGYDVYYEPSTPASREAFALAMERAARLASARQVMMGMEIMDYPFMNSIGKWKKLADRIGSPWFQVYPDVGNLSAWWNDIEAELSVYLPNIVALHLKDTLAVGPDFPGKFRDVPFGLGCVDFTALFSILAKLDYKGSFVVEMWTEKAHNPLEEIAKARRWMLRRMEEGGFAHA